MTYSPPDRDELREMVLAESRARLPEMDVTDGGEEHSLHTVPATAAVAASGYAKGLHRSIQALYASGEDLSSLASMWGLTRHAATGAEGGTLTVNVTTATGSWLITQQFQSADGLTYVATSAGTWSGSPASVEIPFEAVDTGAATTKAVGTVFTVLSPPAGMESTGYINAGDGFTTAGRDEETDEELRDRLTNLFAGTANSGNLGDYVRWMEEVEGVTEGFAYPTMRNNLSIDGTVFGPDTVPGGRWVTASVVTDIENYINGTATVIGQRAVGQDFDGVLPTAQDQAVDVTITADSGYGRDWGAASTDTIPNANIVSVPATGEYIRVNVDPAAAPRNITVGDRLGLNIRTASSATHYHLEVRTVTNIVTVGVNYDIYVDTPLSSNTYTGDVYPAGPTTEDTVTAIEDAFDALGPANDATSGLWPPVSSENPCDLSLAETNRRVMDVEIDGVRRHLNTSWTTPAADVTATTSTIAAGVLVANTIRLTTTRIRYTNLNT